MAELLLSFFSATALSWAGFAILIFAMLGEVVIWLIPETANTHKNLAFAFAALAVAGYAIERVGDDATVHELETRATTAEDAYKSITTPRSIDGKQYAALVECLRAAPKGPVYVFAGLSDLDAGTIAPKIWRAFKDAGFADPPPWNGGGKGNNGRVFMSWNFPGLVLMVNNPYDKLLHLQPIASCLATLKIPMTQRTDDEQPEGTFTVGVGSRL
jgi:hypothetical protein